MKNILLLLLLFIDNNSNKQIKFRAKDRQYFLIVSPVVSVHKRFGATDDSSRNANIADRRRLVETISRGVAARKSADPSVRLEVIHCKTPLRDVRPDETAVKFSREIRLLQIGFSRKDINTRNTNFSRESHLLFLNVKTSNPVFCFSFCFSSYNRFSKNTT